MLPSTGTNWEIKKNLGEVECQDCGFGSLALLNMPILILEGYGKNYGTSCIWIWGGNVWGNKQ